MSKRWGEGDSGPQAEMLQEDRAQNCAGDRAVLLATWALPEVDCLVQVKRPLR